MRKLAQAAEKGTCGLPFLSHEWGCQTHLPLVKQKSIGCFASVAGSAKKVCIISAIACGSVLQAMCRVAFGSLLESSEPVDSQPLHLLGNAGQLARLKVL